MIRLIDTYLKYLETHPDLIHSIILWNVTMFFVYFILLKYRAKMIAGSEGENRYWEMAEQWGYLWLYVSAPITCYSAYFKVNLPDWVNWFNIGIACYTIGGRWLFEWVLALRAGSTKVETETTQVTLEKKETKTTDESK